MRDPYSVLGILQDATDEEVKNAYRDLARKYHPDNYRDDNPLKDLAKEKMQEINAAYDEIQRRRAEGAKSYSGSSSYSGGSSAGGVYIDIRNKINQKRFREAEDLLATVSDFDRTADWHFLTSVCLMQKGMTSDAIRELEIACSMDPSNMEYQKAKEAFNSMSGAYGSTYYGSAPNQRRRSSSDDACDCCANLICLDCLCECMGGDLIACC